MSGAHTSDGLGGTRSWRALSDALVARRSLRGKLLAAVLLTTAIALLVEGGAMLRHDLMAERESTAADLATQADILSLSTAAALAFDDRKTADRNLKSLQARSTVRVAALYDAGGRLYARYVRPGATPPPVQLVGSSGILRDRDWLEYRKPIYQQGELLGTVYLRIDSGETARTLAYLGIFGLVSLLALGVALVVSVQLHARIIRPLEDMATVARDVVERRDYSLRARDPGRDEIGLVVAAFNSMLDEVANRARALEIANAKLTDEIRVRQAAEDALGLANARLESTMAAAEVGSWAWDLRAGRFQADRNVAALYGVTEAELDGDPQQRLARIHPDDVPGVLAAETEALATGVLASTEFRLCRPDGSTRWVARRGRVQFDAHHQPVLLTALLIDVTAQKKAEEALRASELLYRAIGESTNYGVWVCDPAGGNQYTSDSFLRLTGTSQAQCSGLGWTALLHPDDTEATVAAWRHCVAAGGSWYREHRIRGADGEYHAVLAQGAPIRGDGGEVTGWAGINLDIAKLKATEQALRAADRRKDEFLATLAHELRNPLAPIRHAVRLLESPATADRERKWARDVIARQVQRMALLLDDLLEVSRITRGRLVLKPEVTELGALIAAAVETARPLIDAKRQTLDVAMPNESLALNVDALRLSQALCNLLTNASKYTDASGRIGLAVTVAPEQLLFEVRDTGIGLSPSTIPTLFEMFSQVSSAIDRAEGGLGIGLALVKGLVTLHGGTVEASSPGLGGGSTFTIRLPRSVVVAHRDSGQSVASVPPADAARGCKVLIADDNRDAADSLAMLLRSARHAVHVAYSGRDAIDVALRERPDALILDIGMPGVTGFDVARRVREQPWARSVLLVAATGWGQDEDKERTRAVGFDHHLTKPVDPILVEGLLRALSDDRAADGRDGRSR